MKSFRILSVIVFVFISFWSAENSVKADNDCNITLNRIGNYWPGYIPNWVEAGIPIDFKIRATYSGDGAANAIRGLFKLSSPDGATWQPIAGSWSPEFLLNHSGFFTSLYYRSNDGQFSDTAAFSSFDQGAVPSFVTGSSEIAWIINTHVDSSEIGKTICIDSVSFIALPFGHTWVWGLSPTGLCSPAWNGPHCFEIVASCCQGERGDVNGDGVDNNILDLNYLVDKVFRSGPLPPCPLEADLDGDGQSATILDMNFLINFTWRDGPAPGSCP